VHDMALFDIKKSNIKNVQIDIKITLF